PFEIEQHTIHITTSAGIGIYPGHGEDPDTLIERADRALYEAKHAGKNIFRISQTLLTPPLSPSEPFSGSADRLDSDIESV
ncbi:MAG: diguanylate cyclase, partial [Holophaga sp.]|nr:diguanylate cyclase [Holophaga sp.]